MGKYEKLLSDKDDLMIAIFIIKNHELISDHLGENYILNLS